MQYGDEKKEKLNRLERKLYSRNTPNIIDKGRSDFNQSSDQGGIVGIGEENEKIKESWTGSKTGGFDELAAKVSRMANRKNNLVKKIFIFSIIFFVLAVGVAAFVFLGGINSVSSKNVDIKVVGPLSTPGGQEVSLDINVINNNSVDLNSVSLLVEYPTSTRSVADPTKELTQERFVLDKIKSGESYDQNIKAIFFGEKDDLKQIKISLEYRVENSSALFYKEKIYEISLSSSPIIITPTYPKEVNSNQEISFNIEVASNSKDKLSNFLVNVEYPFGFVFEESTPKSSFGNNVWQFPELNSGEKKTILIKGNIIGQDNEEKVFKINAGTASADDERTIAIPFSQLMESVLIKKSFIGLDVFIEGQEGDFAAQNNDQVTTEFTITNNLPSKLFNTSVEVALSGGALDQSNVSPEDNGFFQSSDNTILWDKRGVTEFSEMEPGSEKNLSFRLSPLLYTNVIKGAKPEINMVITTKGERILDSGSAESVSAVETRKIVLATNIDLSSKAVRSIGNFENSGPMPPKAGTPTTYTVVWSVSNSFNQASNVEVRAVLPPYVKWTNLKSPANEIFSFNPVTNEVIWDVGSLLPNTGFSSPKKEIYFQLEFLPSISQVGQTPNILGEASLSGIDKVTGLKIESKVPAVTTDFSGDPSFKMGDDKVVQ
jgi:hypothetical protein